jgi:hypothetical protein
VKTGVPTRVAPRTLRSEAHGGHAAMMKIALAVLLLLASVAFAEAQTAAPVQVVGTVQWINGQGMALALETGSSAHIDLTQVEQESYQRLAAGDRIVVIGTLAPRPGRVLATAVIPAR